MGGDVLEGPVDCIGRDDIVQILNEMNTGKVPGPSDVSMELIAASITVGIQAMLQLCQSSS